MADRTRWRAVAVHPHADLYGSDRMFLESVVAMQPGVLAVLSRRGPLLHALQERGVTCEVRAFPVLRKVELRSPLPALVFLLRLVASVVSCTVWLRRQQMGLVYVSTVAAPSWLVAGRLSGARVVCHVHESEPGMPRWASTLLLAPTLAADAVVANSDDCLAWLRRALGARRTRTARVVHNGVRRPDGGRGLPREADRRRLVVVGRLASRKGQDVALAATALVRDAGYAIELVLVGDGYPGYEDYAAGLRSLAADLGLTGAVTFTGFTDPAPYVAGADVVLVPSRVEPFGLVAVEAQLHARPVVATRVGGLSEIIRDGVTGLLVEPDDAKAMADAVIRLLRDPVFAAAVGDAGREDARSRFSLESYAERLLAAVYGDR